MGERERGCLTNLESCVAKRLSRYQPCHPNLGTKEDSANTRSLCDTKVGLLKNGRSSLFSYINVNLCYYGDTVQCSHQKTLLSASRGLTKFGRYPSWRAAAFLLSEKKFLLPPLTMYSCRFISAISCLLALLDGALHIAPPPS